MSRLGKKPIQIPENVEIKIDTVSGIQKIAIKGPKGELSENIVKEIKVEIKDKQIFVFPQLSTKNIKALWGLVWANIRNMIKGVTEGYEKRLVIEGVGYGAEVKGEEVVLRVGYINLIKVPIPKGITVAVEKNIIKVSGIDKILVGQVAANIRKVKPAEPYKGKGIKYEGEVIIRKVGKRVVAAGAK